jgi:methyl-accepting chemotaxis protein
MNWKKMTVGKKIGVGFGIVLTLLTVVGLLSYVGVDQIVGNAKTVIAGNQLDGELAQKEVDHLNWANQVNALLTDKNLHELTVQTDHHKCGFGQWLYGAGRQEAEAMVPGLKPLLQKIETPHQHLHASAIAIGQLYKQVDAKLGGFLREKKGDHLAWTNAVKDALIKNSQSKLAVHMDPRQCGLGKWLYSAETTAKRSADPELDALLRALEEPHNKLHQSAHRIEELLMAGDTQGAIDFYERTVAPAATSPWRRAPPSRPPPSRRPPHRWRRWPP